MSDCTCYVTPEKYWTTHYGAVEPGSQMEPNPDCPEHFPESRPMSDWAIHESGMISQSLTDMTDGTVRMFTETAAEHNQAIHDAKGES